MATYDRKLCFLYTADLPPCSPHRSPQTQAMTRTLFFAVLLLLAVAQAAASGSSTRSPPPPECKGRADSSGAFSQALLPCTSERSTTCSTTCRSALEKLGYSCVLAGSIRLSPATPVATVTKQVNNVFANCGVPTTAGTPTPAPAASSGSPAAAPGPAPVLAPAPGP